MKKKDDLRNPQRQGQILRAAGEVVEQPEGRVQQQHPYRHLQKRSDLLPYITRIPTTRQMRILYIPLYRR